MGYLLKGYLVVCLSPVLSVLLYFLIGSLWMTIDWFLSIVLYTLVQVSVICIQMLGLALCLIGIRRKEHIPFNTLLNVFLALWGIFTIAVAIVFYSMTLQWSSQPGVRSLTVWDYLEYATWAVKGLLWVLAGIIFEVKTILKEKSDHTYIPVLSHTVFTSEAF